MVARGLATALDKPLPWITHRLMGDWHPTPQWFASLSQVETGEDVTRPYPFFLASPLEVEPGELGQASEWQAEWKWDGIRAQAIRRQGQVCLWTRGEELVTDAYPEIARALSSLARDAVLDGELLQWFPGEEWPRPFGQLQKRLGRKTVSKKLQGQLPVALQVYDCLEIEGQDLRPIALERRRQILEEIFLNQSSPVLRLSPILSGDWSTLAELRQKSREVGTEGLMLKRLDSPYRDGRVRGDWWKWKVNPFSVDAVLVAAQGGRGRRASLHTDYTFAVWDAGKLVTIAKAYSGLTDDEIVEVDRFVRANTREKFGPGRTVEPLLVFELAFEGIQRSTASFLVNPIFRISSLFPTVNGEYPVVPFPGAQDLSMGCLHAGPSWNMDPLRLAGLLPAPGFLSFSAHRDPSGGVRPQAPRVAPFPPWPIG